MVEFQITEDGSHTLFSEMAGQTYHSSHGAVQESRHIFISQLALKCQRSMVDGRLVEIEGQGLTDPSAYGSSPNSGEQLEGQRSMVDGRRLAVLEIGFGTGLNALLTACWAEENGVRVDFSTIELYPLEERVYRELNYGRLLGHEELFVKLHEAEWNVGLQEIVPEFAICKYKRDIVEWLRNNSQFIIHNSQLSDTLDLTHNFQFDVVFFDAFSPEAQPELWTEEVFRNVYGLMKKGGVLTTYCAKGDVRRAMLAAGFRVEKLQGPPGKRHILRAEKE